MLWFDEVIGTTVAEVRDVVAVADDVGAAMVTDVKRWKAELAVEDSWSFTLLVGKPGNEQKGLFKPSLDHKLKLKDQKIAYTYQKICKDHLKDLWELLEVKGNSLRGQHLTVY